jgi:hypothetical protein
MNPLLGRTVSDAQKNVDLFTWFCFTPADEPLEVPTPGALVFRPSGDTFRRLVAVELTVAPDETITRATMQMLRRFIDNADQATNAGDLLKSFVYFGSDPGMEKLAEEIMARSFGRSSRPVIMRGDGPQAPGTPSPCYEVVAGQREIATLGNTVFSNRRRSCRPHQASGLVLAPFPPRSVRRTALGLESLLEIGFGVQRPIPFRRAVKYARLGHGRLRRLEIIGMVGGEAKLAARPQRRPHVAHEIGLHQTPVPMPPLRPRIGKHHMRDGNAPRRQQVAHGVAKLQPQDTHVRQLSPRRALLDLAHAPEQPLDRQQVDLRMLLRVGNGKAAIPRAQVKFDGMVVAENPAPVEALAKIGDGEAMR